MKLKQPYLGFALIVAAAPVLIFIYYLNYVFRPFCWHFGYTQCAAIGEDFFQILQSSYNFFHNYFIYGQPAAEHTVTPYFVTMRYFPTTDLLWGWLFVFLEKNITAYFNLYLPLSIVVHLISVYLLYLIAQKFKASKIIFYIAVIFWLTYFPLTSEWRMGQFNHLAGIFFLGLITAEIYGKKILSAILWILSLSWKPLTLFVFFYYFLRKNMTALWLFGFFFIIFPIIYLLYWHRIYDFAISQFLKDILILSDRFPVQVHYIDNFGVFSWLGELFYNRSPSLYQSASKVYLLAVPLTFFVVTKELYRLDNYKLNLQKLYYLLFCGATMMLFHKEVWESILTFWLPIITVLMLITKSKKELTLIIVCSLFLAAPSLFYFWEITKNEIWRFWMITEKAVPQLVLYGYLIYKIRATIKS